MKVTKGSCPLPGDCSFEDGICTYSNVQQGDKFDWLIGSGATSSLFTGPAVDHTTGSSTGIVF